MDGYVSRKWLQQGTGLNNRSREFTSVYNKSVDQFVKKIDVKLKKVWLQWLKYFVRVYKDFLNSDRATCLINFN